MKISGSFDVKLQPQEVYEKGRDGVVLGRMSIDKTFHGELNGTSKGEMLSTMTGVKGSAGYVAIEQFSGTLSGKKGCFVIQHFGTMTQSDQFQLLRIVPNSGSEELSGISGEMMITIENGQHFYELNYAIS